MTRTSNPESRPRSPAPLHRDGSTKRPLHPLRTSAPARLLALSLLLSGFALVESRAGALSPEESLARIEVEPGFRVELFAAEPDVIDPVAMTFDARGRAFVCEMREMEDLPATVPGTKGVVRMLEDSDGDGRADRSVVFADGLSFPGGIVPFRDGFYVLCTPDLLWLRDTDGDDVADERRVVLTGFAQGNAEHRFNNLKWDPEDRIHAANGGGGGVLSLPGASVVPGSPVSPPLDLSGRDFSFDPWAEMAFESNRASGGPVRAPDWFRGETRQTAGGFGLTFDERGRKFVCHNEMHCSMVVMQEADLARNPSHPTREIALDVTAHPGPSDPVFPLSEPQRWRIDRTDRRAREMADKFRPDQLRVNGYFTAACGVTSYRSALFPPSHRGSIFVCDAAQNLVHRARVEESGSIVSVIRADEGTEFLRSSEQWFRPVNLEQGPDGALYVLDFHREIIETAASIPDDILATLDLRAGADMGRIYRVVPDATATSRERPQDGRSEAAADADLADADLADQDLADAADDALCEALPSGTLWRRATARRLLLERDARTSSERLRSMATDPRAPDHARAAAIGILARWGELDEATRLAALGDPAPRVRETALRAR